MIAIKLTCLLTKVPTEKDKSEIKNTNMTLTMVSVLELPVSFAIFVLPSNLFYALVPKQVNALDNYRSSALYPDEMDFQQALKSVHESADQARQVLLHYLWSLVEGPGKRSMKVWWTEADVESERAITRVLSRDFPDPSRIRWARGRRGPEWCWSVPETAWIVDPLDGTDQLRARLSILLHQHRFDLSGPAESRGCGRSGPEDSVLGR